MNPQQSLASSFYTTVDTVTVAESSNLNEVTGVVTRTNTSEVENDNKSWTYFFPIFYLSVSMYVIIVGVFIIRKMCHIRNWRKMIINSGRHNDDIVKGDGVGGGCIRVQLRG